MINQDLTDRITTRDIKAKDPGISTGEVDRGRDLAISQDLTDRITTRDIKAKDLVDLSRDQVDRITTTDTTVKDLRDRRDQGKGRVGQDTDLVDTSRVMDTVEVDLETDRVGPHE